MEKGMKKRRKILKYLCLMVLITLVPVHLLSGRCQMFENFYPELVYEKINDVDFKVLREKGIKGLILDIDNTIVPPHTKDADENAIEWIKQVKKEGFKVCIVSNASKDRVDRFNEKLKIDAIHRASKPAAKSFLKACEIMGTKPGETAVIGDQIFTDILGGNNAGMFTILIKPIDVSKEWFFIKFKRVLEKIIMSKWEQK